MESPVFSMLTASCEGSKGLKEAISLAILPPNDWGHQMVFKEVLELSSGLAGGVQTLSV